MNQESSFAKEIVLSFLEFLHYKIKNDKLTLPEADRVARTIEKEIGPTSSGAEFVDTFTHEIHHLAVNIAAELGIDLESETPAYIAGDSARALADAVCTMGCQCCRHE